SFRVGQARHDLALAQIEQLTVERSDLAIRLLDRGYDLAALESVDGQRIGDALACIGRGESRKAGEFAAASLAHGVAEIAGEIAEEQERHGRTDFLSHEEQRRRWREKLDRDRRYQRLARHQRDQPLAESSIADLVVVLQEVDESQRRQMRARLAARRIPERRMLALIGKSMSQRAAETARICRR